MSNGSEACCVLGICCPADAASQRASLVKILVEEGGCAQDEACKAADVLALKFAFAPKSFAGVVAEIIAIYTAHGTH